MRTLQSIQGNPDTRLAASLALIQGHKTQVEVDQDALQQLEVWPHSGLSAVCANVLLFAARVSDGVKRAACACVVAGVAPFFHAHVDIVL